MIGEFHATKFSWSRWLLQTTILCNRIIHQLYGNQRPKTERTTSCEIIFDKIVLAVHRCNSVDLSSSKHSCPLIQSAIIVFTEDVRYNAWQDRFCQTEDSRKCIAYAPKPYTYLHIVNYVVTYTEYSFWCLQYVTWMSDICRHIYIYVTCSTYGHIHKGMCTLTDV